jgi:hypothetical protein
MPRSPRLTEYASRPGTRGRRRFEDLRQKVLSWTARARKAAPTTLIIQQAQRSKRNPYRKFVLERGLAEGGAKLALNELGAISFTMRGRGDRTAT